MKMPLLISIAAAVTGTLALLALSAMTIMPRSGAEAVRSNMMLIVGASVISWIAIALWLLIRQRKKSRPALPIRLGRALIIAGSAYIFFLIVFVIG